MFKIINGKVLKDEKIWEKINSDFLYEPNKEEQTFIEECFEIFARGIDILITIYKAEERESSSYRDLIELMIRYYGYNERSYDLYTKMRKHWR